MCYPFVSTTEWARRRFLIISVCRPEARQNRCWNTSDDSDTACDRSGAVKSCLSGGSSAERTCSLTATTRFLALVSAQSSPVERRAAEGLTHCSRVHKLSSSWLNRSLLMHFICAELKALKDFFFPTSFQLIAVIRARTQGIIFSVHVCKLQIRLNWTFLMLLSV